MSYQVFAYDDTQISPWAQDTNYYVHDDNGRMPQFDDTATQTKITMMLQAQDIDSSKFGFASDGTLYFTDLQDFDRVKSAMNNIDMSDITPTGYFNNDYIERNDKAGVEFKSRSDNQSGYEFTDGGMPVQFSKEEQAAIRQGFPESTMGEYSFSPDGRMVFPSSADPEALQARYEEINKKRDVANNQEVANQTPAQAPEQPAPAAPENDGPFTTSFTSTGKPGAPEQSPSTDEPAATTDQPQVVQDAMKKLAGLKEKGAELTPEDVNKTLDEIQQDLFDAGKNAKSMDEMKAIMAASEKIEAMEEAVENGTRGQAATQEQGRTGQANWLETLLALIDAFSKGQSSIGEPEQEQGTYVSTEAPPAPTQEGPAVAEKPAPEQEGPAVAEKPAPEQEGPAVAEKPAPEQEGPAVAEKPAPEQEGPAVAEKPAPTQEGPAVAEKPAPEQEGPAVAEKPAPTQEGPAVTEKPAPTQEGPAVAEKPAPTQEGSAVAEKPAPEQEGPAVAEKPAPTQEGPAVAEKPAPEQEGPAVAEKPAPKKPSEQTALDEARKKLASSIEANMTAKGQEVDPEAVQKQVNETLGGMVNADGTMKDEIKGLEDAANKLDGNTKLIDTLANNTRLLGEAEGRSEDEINTMVANARKEAAGMDNRAIGDKLNGVADRVTALNDQMDALQELNEARGKSPEEIAEIKANFQKSMRENTIPASNEDLAALTSGLKEKAEATRDLRDAVGKQYDVLAQNGATPEGLTKDQYLDVVMAQTAGKSTEAIKDQTAEATRETEQTQKDFDALARNEDITKQKLKSDQEIGASTKEEEADLAALDEKRGEKGKEQFGNSLDLASLGVDMSSMRAALAGVGVKLDTEFDAPSGMRPDEVGGSITEQTEKMPETELAQKGGSMAVGDKG